MATSLLAGSVRAQKASISIGHFQQYLNYPKDHGHNFGLIRNISTEKCQRQQLEVELNLITVFFQQFVYA